MYRIGTIVLAALLFACTDNKPAPAGKEKAAPAEKKSTESASTSLPYQLTDTALLNNKDTASIHGMAFSEMIPDSVLTKIFGKTRKLKYVQLGQFDQPGKAHFFIVKVEGGRHKAALLLSFDQDRHFGAAFPFLVPDEDPSTTQVSTIDKAYSISRTVLRKQPDDVLAEGKDVYVYNSNAKQFVLIMTDLLDDKNVELINPIDTLPKTNKLAGDYVRDKKNIISIRDGRKPNLLSVFVHIDKEKSDCSGELKGEAEITSPTTAVYRQAGDPCVLQFTFGPSSVSLTEKEGCGAHRGLECAFDGSFPRKKEGKMKTSKKNKRNS